MIGPKELPAVLRTIGQWTTKIRRMAGEFQSQFQEAMREAEMADLKKEVDHLNDAAKGFTSNLSSPFDTVYPNEGTKWEPKSGPDGAVTTDDTSSADVAVAAAEAEAVAAASPAADDGAGAVTPDGYSAPAASAAASPPAAAASPPAAAEPMSLGADASEAPAAPSISPPAAPAAPATPAAAQAATAPDAPVPEGSGRA